MISPVHLLPSRWKIVIAIGVALLFAYGTVKFLLEREWGYAATTGSFVALVFVQVRRMFQLGRRAEAMRRNGVDDPSGSAASKPIE